MIFGRFFRKYDFSMVLALGMLPLASIVGIPLYIYYNGVVWQEPVVLIVGWFLAGSGITMGYHRLFAHKAFKANWIYEIFVLWSTNLIGLRSPIGWMGVHRMHHHHSDTKGDPHSPLNLGFWKVLFGLWKVENIPTKYVRDLYKNPRILFFHKYWHIIWFTQILIALLISWKFLIAYTVIPSILSLIGFGLVNGLCHIGGKSRNVPIINLLTAGEGYHAEHHKGKNFRFHKYDQTGALLEWMLRKKIIAK